MCLFLRASKVAGVRERDNEHGCLAKCNWGSSHISFLGNRSARSEPEPEPQNPGGGDFFPFLI